MTEIRITIPGQPVPKESVRADSTNAHMPKKTRAYLDLVAQCAMVAMVGKTPLSGPVAQRWTSYREIPASWPKWKQKAAREGLILPTSVPDYTNLVKMEDGMKGIVWNDDAQVVRADIAKEYSDDPRTEIIVFPVSGFPSTVTRAEFTAVKP